jgi:hypothetical protein
MKFSTKKLLTFFGFTILCLTLMHLGSSKAYAVTGADWVPGRIIDDVIFFNKDASTVQQLQDFLNSKVPVCDTAGTGLTNRWNAAAARYYTRAEWGATVNNPAPFTCLKDYVENPVTKVNNYNKPAGYVVPGGVSAAQILYNTAQAHNINPQALLVILQKEQSLVTDNWPYRVQFDSAMGASCPDTGPGGSANCDATYNGFANQMNRAGVLFNYYKNNLNQYSYNVGISYVLWNVAQTNCGGGNVNIQNVATAMLYIYTPYQPNQAALNNLYGTGDACSAYGNRNFWRMFNDWFGTTVAPDYSYSSVEEKLYTDIGKTTPVTPNTAIVAGKKYYAHYVFKNTGNQTWSKTNTRIGSNKTQNHSSVLCSNTWLSSDCSRYASLIENTVAPGGLGTFDFEIQVPYQQTNTVEYINLVADGAAWMKDIDASISINTGPLNYSAQQTKFESFADQALTVNKDPSSLKPGESIWLKLTTKNNGNVLWKNTFTRLGLDGSIGRSSAFKDTSWVSSDRPATMAETETLPGQLATFVWKMNSPLSSKSYTEDFSVVLDGLSWSPYNGTRLSTQVSPGFGDWQFIGQNLFTDSTKSIVWNSTAPSPVDKAYAVVVLKNNTGVYLNKNSATQLNLGTARVQNRTSIGCNVISWLGCNRPAIQNEASVAPGGQVTFEFWLNLQAPYTDKEYFQPVIDGAYWLKDNGLYFNL